MADVMKKMFELLVGSDSMGSMPTFSLPKRTPASRKLTKRELIQLESEIGAQLFGPVPKGHRREFFNLDPKTWIWHEEWIDHSGKKRMSTTRYEIHENGILKAQEGARYSFLEGHELDNFLLSTKLYFERVMREVYEKDPQTKQSLVAA